MNLFHVEIQEIATRSTTRAAFVFLAKFLDFPTRISDCDSHSPAFLDLFLSSDASICSTMDFPSLGNCDHLVVSVSVDLSSNSK